MMSNPSSDKVLSRWLEAGLIDRATADRISAWEGEHAVNRTDSRFAATAFRLGGLLLIAGMFLFVSAHWDELGPGARFTLMLGVVAALHVAGALSAASMPSLSTTLHAVGTAAMGGAIFLCGQIFNLAEHWPGALMLWALGAVMSLYLLRDWPHVLWVAVLVPAWLLGEWIDAATLTQSGWDDRVPAVGTFLLALTYLSAMTHEKEGAWRRVLSRLGAVLLVPAGIVLGWDSYGWRGGVPPGAHDVNPHALIDWGIALALPFSLAIALRGRQALYLIIALVWACAVAQISWRSRSGELAVYGLYAVGAVGIVAWGIRERLRNAVNIGVLAFALTIFGFYFSALFDKLGRSLGLIGMGLLFLGGGRLIERARRRLIARVDDRVP